MSPKFKIIFFYLFLFVAVLVVIGVVVIIFLSSKELTERENGLLTILLTVFSIISTWLISHNFSSLSYDDALQKASESHQSNLKNYALRAAEKVNNLSEQLESLSIYLQNGLETDFDNLHLETMARGERILSAVQIIDSYKSFNDTSLRDWQGVIGEELEQQKAEKEEKQEEFSRQLKNLNEKFEKMNTEEIEKSNTHGNISAELRMELDYLKRGLNFLSRATGNRSTFQFKPKPKQERVYVNCLNCPGTLNYRQNISINSIKAVTCKECGTKFVSRLNEDKHIIIELRKDIVENISCPNCGKENNIKLDPIPGVSKQFICEECGSNVNISRGISGVKIEPPKKTANPPGSDIPITEDMLKKIKELFPEQPWPKETHKIVAKKLGVSNSYVGRASEELIRRGDFKLQKDGVLYKQEK